MGVLKRTSQATGGFGDISKEAKKTKPKTKTKKNGFFNKEIKKLVDCL